MNRIDSDGQQFHQYQQAAFKINVWEIEGANKNGQSREIGNIGHIRRRQKKKQKQKKTTHTTQYLLDTTIT